jgi:hypothetical protein
MLMAKSSLANWEQKLTKNWVQVQLVLNFSDLNTIQGATNTVLCGKHYIQLPQLTVQLTNATSNQYHLMTFTGPADLRTLSAEKVKHQILEVTHQDGPFDLLA